MEQYEHLFKAVNQIVQQAKVAKEESRLRGEQFNIFKVCGIDHYELQHSKIIAELLNPEGSHGQGCLYLKLFMETYGSKLNIQDISPQNISVVPEERSYNENKKYNGRMDIFIEKNNVPLVIIENKINANDQPIQLKKYNNEAKRRNAKDGEYEIVYLSLDGKDASKDSGEGVKYIRMSYAKDIIKWLNKCIEHSSRIPMVRETLKQYQNHIKQLTHQDMGTEFDEKMFEIMSNYQEEIATIINRQWDYLEYIYNKYAKKAFEEFAEKSGLSYKENGIWNNRKEGGFYFHKPEWHYAIYIWHNTWSGGFYIGVSWHGEKPQVMPNYGKLDCFSGEADDTWPYGYAYLGKYSNWDAYTAIDIKNGEFAKAITENVSTVLKEIEDKRLPM